MATYSISRLGMFRQCPRRYKFAYIERLPVEFKDTVEAFLGSRVHEALEKLYRDKRHEKEPSLQELLQGFNQTWSENWSDKVLLVRQDYTADHYRRMGERFLGDYYRRYAPFDQGRVVGLETQETVALDEAGTYRLHVRIDRLVDMGAGLYEVHDYKTSSELPGQEELDRDVQLGAYSLWVRRHFKDFRRVRLVWHFLAFDKELDSWRTEADLESVRQELLNEIRTVEAAAEFPPQTSALCGWCLYRTLCPMWRHESATAGLPETELQNDQGVRFVDEYVRVKAEADALQRETRQKLEKLEREIVDYCRQDLSREKVAVISGSKNRVTVKELEQVKWPARNSEENRRLTAVLKDLNLWDRVADLDAHALSRVLKNEGELSASERSALASFKLVEKVHRLTVSRKKVKESD
jgi:putative RecB family exonuclease